MCALFWRVTTHESVASSVASHLLVAHSWSNLHTLSYTTLTLFPPKYKVSKCELQANLAWNKANTYLNKFNFTHIYQAGWGGVLLMRRYLLKPAYKTFSLSQNVKWTPQFVWLTCYDREGAYVKCIRYLLVTNNLVAWICSICPGNIV